MRVPVNLADAFGAPFEEMISEFSVAHKLIPDAEALKNKRYLSRSVIPHVKKLSSLFNRLTPRSENDEMADDEPSGPAEKPDQSGGLDPYWKQSSNPSHLRMAYFLYFMPSNLFRIASIWSELGRLGYRWQGLPRLRGIEFGAGPAAGATGIAAGESVAQLGLPTSGDWALIEQDRATLKLGAEWAEKFFQSRGLPDWGTRTFHRTIDIQQGFLPPTAPKFNLWVMSFFLNELLGEKASPAQVAKALMDCWEKHLEEESIIILAEPALKLQSRKLLMLRQALLTEIEKRDRKDFKLLLPCLGHQNCGALEAPDDWCHEEVSWWRPPYFKIIDQLAGLDRKTLPFSYLVFARSKKSRAELLPVVGADATQRLVSPAHKEGKELEFFICGSEGKRRARFKPEQPLSDEDSIGRGDVLIDADVRGDANASRIDHFKKKI